MDFPIKSLFLFPNFWNSFSSHLSIMFNDFRIDYSHSYIQSDYKFTFKAFHWMLAEIFNFKHLFSFEQDKNQKGMFGN